MFFVTVTDANGQLIYGLRASDYQALTEAACFARDTYPGYNLTLTVELNEQHHLMIGFSGRYPELAVLSASIGIYLQVVASQVALTEQQAWEYLTCDGYFDPERLGLDPLSPRQAIPFVPGTGIVLN